MRPFGKYAFLVLIPLLRTAGIFAQLTVPWSSSLNITFDKWGSPGLPLPPGSTDFTYTTNACPLPGQYTLTNNEACAGMDARNLDAGHFFFTPVPVQNQPPGYMMLGSYHPSATPVIVFTQAVHNLCPHYPYFFWASILDAGASTCFLPNFTFSVETLSGTPIASFPTGDIQYPSGGYPGYFGPISRPPPFGYYGGNFSLPAGVTDIVVRIIANPSTANPDCSASFLLDNILVTPEGPDVTVSDPAHPGSFLASVCFQGGQPLVLDGSIGPNYLPFLAAAFVNAGYTNPAMQWQQSLDEGYTWTDIPGATGPTLSQIFSVPDTFHIRVRTSESGDIGNPNCSVVSNIIEVDVNGLPDKFSMSSNSPVCSDTDLVFKLSGGATYLINGPNGYSDNTAFPHIFHPKLVDSGWYYAQITTSGGCFVEDSTHVVIYGPDVQVSPDESICYGRTVRLEASGGASYAWTPAAGLSNPGQPDPLASPLSTTQYQVKVTDQRGCSGFGSVKITLLDTLLKAAFSGPDVACPSDVISFIDSSQGKISNWEWDFGNGQHSQEQSPAQQLYPTSRALVNYPVQLIVGDSAGCRDTATRSIASVNNCHIAVPSAFTPNGDGNNDYLYPLDAYKATNLVFRVYNRNGLIVFQTRDWTKKWDGRVNGQMQPEGVYVWTLEYTDEDHKRQAFKGTTVLLR